MAGTEFIENSLKTNILSSINNDNPLDAFQ